MNERGKLPIARCQEAGMGDPMTDHLNIHAIVDRRDLATKSESTTATKGVATESIAIALAVKFRKAAAMANRMRRSNIWSGDDGAGLVELFASDLAAAADLLDPQQ